MTGDKTALLVIDVQKELFQKTTPICNADALLENINALVGRAHRAGAPVVYVQHSSKNILVEGSDGWQLHPKLQPLSTDVMIRKTHPSSFEETSLAEDLAKMNVGTLVITGLVTHGCVKATSLAALELGYRTIVAKDAHSSYSKDAARLIEEWNQKLGAAGAQVQAAKDIDFQHG
jgi:nicotinamidase-related amidase